MQGGFPVLEGPGKSQFTYEGYIFNVSKSSKNCFCVRRYANKKHSSEISCPAYAIITKTACDGLRVSSLENEHNHSVPVIEGGRVVQEFSTNRNTTSERQQFISEQKQLADARREYHEKMKEKEKRERENFRNS
jgi:hypothetical protein